MADSAATDLSKMKVIDLRKELKSRGLPSTGDKAELVARLQTALTQDAQDEHADINLDSDEIDSDGVLDEDEKSSHDLLDDSAVESLNEDLALEEQPTAAPPAELKPVNEVKPHRTLKRKITMSESTKDKITDHKVEENKETVAKKIVLNRSSSLNSMTTTPAAEKTEEDSSAAQHSNDDLPTKDSNKIKIAADLDIKTRLELRAKRFGLPVKMSDTDKKEARKQRFGLNTSSQSSSILPGEFDSNLDKLKKRTERFGQSVSKIMAQVENQEKLEKRKAKFGTVK